MLKNGCAGITEVAEALNISYGSTPHIVVHVLRMKRVAARFVPKNLNSSLIVTEFLVKHETKVIAEPPYSPDLAHGDFFMFPKLKYSLRGTRHGSIEAIKRNSQRN